MKYTIQYKIALLHVVFPQIIIWTISFNLEKLWRATLRTHVVLSVIITTLYTKYLEFR